MRYVRSLTAIGVVGTSMLILACAAPIETDRDVPAPSPSSVVPLNAGVAPSELVDTRGRRWVFKRQFAAWAPGRPKLERSGIEPSVADGMSDDDLAEALRPARLHGMAEYILDVPHADLLAGLQNARAKAKAGPFRHQGPLDVARTVGSPGVAPSPPIAPIPLSGNVFRAALGGSFADRRRVDHQSVEGAWSLTPSRPSVDEELGEQRTNLFFSHAYSDTAAVDGPTLPRDILGTDTRSFVSHSYGSSSFPYTATVATGTSISSGGVLNDAHCSANLVGNYTALTAAHCLWDRFAAAPFPRFPIANGVVTTRNQWGAAVQTRAGDALYGWNAYYPSGWTATFSWDFDYGVIEYGSYLPGWGGNRLAVGWQSAQVYRTKPA